MLALVSMNYIRHYDPNYKRYYYVNLRCVAKKSEWKMPPCVTKANDRIVLTPRSYLSVFGTQESADIEWLKGGKILRDQEAAINAKKRMVESMEFSNGGQDLNELNELDRREWDEENKRRMIEEEEAVASSSNNSSNNSVEKDDVEDDVGGDLEDLAVGSPLVAINAINRKKASCASAPTTLTSSSLNQDLNQRVTQRVKIINSQSAPPKSSNNRPMTRIKGSEKIQAACRTYMAKQSLAARAAVIILLVRPNNLDGTTGMGKEGTGRGQKPFYFNISTRESSWNKPKCFGGMKVTEISVAEARKKTRRYAGRNASSSKVGGVVKTIHNINLTYPLSKDAKLDLAATYLQCMVRCSQGKTKVRFLVWNEMWTIEEDYDSAERYYFNGVTGESRWTRPWEPAIRGVGR
jgi:hypothetical protein